MSSSASGASSDGSDGSEVKATTVAVASNRSAGNEQFTAANHPSPTASSSRAPTAGVVPRHLPPPSALQNNFLTSALLQQLSQPSGPLHSSLSSMMPPTVLSPSVAAAAAAVPIAFPATTSPPLHSPQAQAPPTAPPMNLLAAASGSKGDPATTVADNNTNNAARLFQGTGPAASAAAGQQPGMPNTNIMAIRNAAMLLALASQLQAAAATSAPPSGGSGPPIAGGPGFGSLGSPLAGAGQPQHLQQQQQQQQQPMAFFPPFQVPPGTNPSLFLALLEQLATQQQQQQQALPFYLPPAAARGSVPSLPVSSMSQLSYLQSLARPGVAAAVLPPVHPSAAGLAMSLPVRVTSAAAALNPAASLRFVGQAGRPAIPLFLKYDEQALNEYQCLLRQQIELFENGPDDIGKTQGRNNPILLGQVGIRCRYCVGLPKSARPKGSVYYSRSLGGVYQIAQNMAKSHFPEKCRRIPPEVKARLMGLQQANKKASGGKDYWVHCLKVCGVYEDGSVLRFRPVGQQQVPPLPTTTSATSSTSTTSDPTMKKSDA